MQKKNNLQKNPPKRNQNPSRYYNSLSNLKFQHNQGKAQQEIRFKQLQQTMFWFKTPKNLEKTSTRMFQAKQTWFQPRFRDFFYRQVWAVQMQVGEIDL